jgi:D-sedoheptulose 7-phosphate isomerase
MKEYILNALIDARDKLEAFINDPVCLSSLTSATKLIVASLKNNSTILSCGNGGSLCDAMHFAEELSGRFRKNRPALSAICLSDPAHMSCVANDYGYEYVFSRYIEAIGKPGDTLLAISTSGESANIIQAAKQAKANKISVIALSGNVHCSLGKIADVHVFTPTKLKTSDRVQEIHIKCIHILIEMCERSLFKNLYTKIQKPNMENNRLL